MYNPENRELRTINQNSPHITLPLDALVRRLELAGFHLTPAERLRLLHVLSGPAKRFLHDPEQLKYLLGPVVAHSAAEQARFYDIFDTYYAEITAPIPAVAAVKKERKGLSRLWTIGLSALGLGLLAGLLYWLFSPSKPILYFEADRTEAPPGDTIHLRAVWENIDTATVRFVFEVLRDDSVTFRQTVGSTWSYLAGRPGNNPAHTLRLRTEGLPRDTELVQESTLTILCPAAPVIKALRLPAQGKPGEQLSFDFDGSRSDSLVYRWDFGDGGSSTLPTPQHAFASAGVYRVQLSIERPGVDGYCRAVRSRDIAIGEEKALLTALPLQYDALNPRATFGLGAWILLSLIGLGVIYYWVKWSARRPEEPDRTPAAAATRFAAPDRAPYFIPWRDAGSSIRVGREPLRLADVLRLRQEGLRREVDVPASVTATIDQGGFPRLHYRYNTQPTEYLFLVDEQQTGSHLTHLFQYLTRLLQEQDVHIESFYYHGDFHRLWNRQYPGGLSLEVLHRLYPAHRLVVLGDAHGLLDPHAAGQPALRREQAADLARWRHRLLLTPQPPVSWTYREALLHRLFPVFPADLPGQMDAARFIEGGLEIEDLPPTFEQWQQRQQQLRQEPDTNYRRWRTLADHRDYFRDRPDLQRWLAALAVYPQPTWPLTIAIGEALGLDVTFDNLLLLSRIPWLQNGRIPTRLREECLAALPPKDEEAARQAVKRELEAVAADTRDSHANVEVQSSLAVQNFHLDPGEPAHQDAIRYLLAEGLLTPRQLDELNRRVRRHVAEKNAARSSGSMSITVEPDIDLERFLDEEAGKQAPHRPFFTPDFRRAVALSSVFLLLFALIWQLDSTDALYRRVFGEEPQAVVASPDWKPRNYFFVKEDVFVDSAVIYNNQGVEQFAETPPKERVTSFLDGITWQFNLQSLAIRQFREALRVRPDYPLAQSNLGRAYYNRAVQWFNVFQQDSLTPGNYRTSLEDFHEAAGFDSIRYDAWHGLGLGHYYLGRPDSAEFYYRMIESQTDGKFFDTLSIAPNLKTLMLAFQLRDNCYRLVTDDAVLLTLRNRPLSRAETDAMNKDRNSAMSQQINGETQIKSLWSGIVLELLGQEGTFYHVRVGDTIGYLSATLRGQSTLEPCIPTVPGKKQAREALQQKTAPPKPAAQMVIEGRVIDAATGRGLPGANVRLTENLRMEARSPRTYTVATDRTGVFRMDLGNDVYREYQLEVYFAGYDLYERVVTAEQIGKGRLPDIRLNAMEQPPQAEQLPSNAPSGATIFVREGGTGQGASWKDALGDLQVALSKAASGTEIWVAAGAYYPSPKDRTIAFEIPPGVKLYGGFSGYESSLKERVVQKNQTILSGEIGSPSKDDNSYTVVRFFNAGNNTVLDGFIITGGNANGTTELGNLERCGGGVFNHARNDVSNPQINNCIFRDNSGRDGAGLFNMAEDSSGVASPTIVDCSFENNRADLDGGGVYAYSKNGGNSSPRFINTTFQENQASYGAGIFLDCDGKGGQVKPVIQNCSFIRNTSQVRGSAIESGKIDKTKNCIIEPLTTGSKF